MKTRRSDVCSPSKFVEVDSSCLRFFFVVLGCLGFFDVFFFFLRLFSVSSGFSKLRRAL